jgi:hypothetical protein
LRGLFGGVGREESCVVFVAGFGDAFDGVQLGKERWRVLLHFKILGRPLAYNDALKQWEGTSFEGVSYHGNFVMKLDFRERTKYSSPSTLFEYRDEYDVTITNEGSSVAASCLELDEKPPFINGLGVLVQRDERTIRIQSQLCKLPLHQNIYVRLRERPSVCHLRESESDTGAYYLGGHSGRISRIGIVHSVRIVTDQQNSRHHAFLLFEWLSLAFKERSKPA